MEDPSIATEMSPKKRQERFRKVKYSVAQIIGYMKGKSSIWIAQNVERKMRNFLGHKFWARGYFVTTVGRDEEVIRAYIKNQELADQQLEQFELKISAAQNPINRPNIP